MSYATGHNTFTSQYLLNIYIYCRFCRLCIINCGKKSILTAGFEQPTTVCVVTISVRGRNKDERRYLAPCGLSCDIREEYFSCRF
jgi:hypothetical protein